MEERPDIRYESFARECLSEKGRDAEAFALAYNLLHLSTLLVNDLETRIHRPRGWTLPGFRLMFKLWILGPTQPVRLAELSAMSRSAVTNVVHTLEREGLVERRPVAGDRRSQVVALTVKGEQAVREAYELQDTRERQWFAALSDEERDQLVDLLSRLVAARPTP